MSDAPVTQEQLAELVAGATDEQILEFAQAAPDGIDGVLRQIFDAMAERFQPDKAAGQSAVIGWDITAPDGTHSWQVKVADGTCTVTKDGSDEARVTLGLSFPDFLRMITGNLDGMQAFMGGKLRLSGDMMFAQSIQSWFGQ